MNISKRKQGILAIICTIAMIVTSITVYNPREVKADADYSTLTFTKVTESMDSTYAYCITDNTLIDFGKLNFYGVNYMQVIGSGNSKMDEATVTIDGVVQTNNDIAFDRAPATTGSSTKPLGPSDIKDSEWTLASGSKTVSYYIADGKADKVQVKPQLEGDNYYIAFSLAAKFKSVTFDGVSKDVEEGAFCRVKVSDLTGGYHTLVVTDHYGNESVTIYFKVAEGEGTTTPSFEEEKELIPSDKVNAEITLEKHTVGQTEYVQEHKAESIHIESGKWYVGQFTITSSVRKYFEIRVQDAAAEYVSIPANTEFKKVLVEAGQTVNVRVRFKADRTTDSAIFDICMGYIKEESEAGKVQITNNSLKGYTNEPEATKYTVSIDGTEKQYEEGATITVPTEGQGYYDVTKKVAYAPGTELTVNENMTLKSIELNVTMTPGASIRLAAPTGLRFQTTVKSGNGIAADEILNSKTVTTGTLITTLDLYRTNGNTLTKDSTYTVLDIANVGWFNDGTKTETGKFCGSIIKIQKENYGRKFIAVGYATINYSNGDSKTVYAEVTENNAKSIKYVAEKVQASDKFSGYSPEQQAIINKYIEGEEISK